MLNQNCIKKILIKISGESLKSPNGEFLDKTTIFALIDQLKQLVKDKYMIAIVIGGGNIWRGNMSSTLNLDPQTGDYMGMMATIINGIAFRQLLTDNGVNATLYSSIFMPNIAKCINYNEMNDDFAHSILIFSGGVGEPNFSTDSCAALRALELNCDLLLVGKNNVKGVYDKDPHKFQDANLFKKISYEEIIEKNLLIMDQTALTLCRSHNLEIRVFNINEKNAILDVLQDKIFYTTIKD